MREAHLNATAEGQGLSRGERPFIPLKGVDRTLIIGYVLLYNIFTPGLMMMMAIFAIRKAAI